MYKLQLFKLRLHFIFSYIYLKVFYSKNLNLNKTIRLGYKYKIIYETNAKNIFFGNKLTTRDFFYVRICGGGRLIIKNNCFFNNCCSITVVESVEIGNDCIFGENVKIYDHNHVFQNRNELIRNQGVAGKPIIIGDNCWICSNVTILSGVQIGANSIVGAGAVVYKDIPENSIYLNNGVLKELK